MNRRFVGWLLTLVLFAAVAGAQPPAERPGARGPASAVATPSLATLLHPGGAAGGVAEGGDPALRALTEVRRAQLRAEAAAELAAMMVEALEVEKEIASAPDRRPLPRWIAQARRVREELQRVAGALKEEALRDGWQEHSTLHRRLDRFQISAKKRSVAVDNVTRHVAEANVAAAQAAAAAADVARAHKALTALHQDAVRDLERLTARARGTRKEPREPSAEAPEAPEQGDHDSRFEALSGAEGARGRVAQSVPNLVDRAYSVERRRRRAVALAAQAVALTRRAAADARRDASAAQKKAKHRSLVNALRTRDETEREIVGLIRELNALKDVLMASAEVPEAQEDAAGPASAPITTAVALGAGHPAGPEDELKVRALVPAWLGPAEEVAAAEAPASGPAGAEASVIRLRPRALERAQKPPGELLRGGAAGGRWGTAFQEVPELLTAIRSHDATFQAQKARMSGKNRVFWLADGRQILLLSGCRTVTCTERAYIVAYDRMRGEAAFIRRSGRGRIDLFGDPDPHLRALLLWFSKVNLLRRNHELADQTARVSNAR